MLYHRQGQNKLDPWRQIPSKFDEGPQFFKPRVQIATGNFALFQFQMTVWNIFGCKFDPGEIIDPNFFLPLYQKPKLPSKLLSLLWPLFIGIPQHEKIVSNSKMMPISNLQPLIILSYKHQIGTTKNKSFFYLHNQLSNMVEKILNLLLCSISQKDR